MAAAVELLKIVPSAELIWASPRELLNVFHAEAIGCHIITVTNDILKKMKLVDYDLGALLAGHGEDVLRRRAQRRVFTSERGPS